MNRLVEFPMIGASRPHLYPGLRVIFDRRYAIYYLQRGDDAVITRVLHGSRDVQAIVDEGGFAIPFE